MAEEVELSMRGEVDDFKCFWVFIFLVTLLLFALLFTAILTGHTGADTLYPEKVVAAETAEPTVEPSVIPVAAAEFEEPEPVYEGFDPNVDYMAVMVEACLAGDTETGRQAALERSIKIETLGLSETHIDFDELFELSKIITAEAGADRLPSDWKMCVGEVVLNRCDSPEFPDTIHEVIYQPGQYQPAGTSIYESMLPFEDCVDAAARLLTGERVINDPTVVFQAGFRQGSGVCLKLTDEVFGNTYLCYSSYPELYESEAR